MRPIHCVRTLTSLPPVLGLLLFAEAIAAQAPPPSTPTTLPNETPAQITPVTDSFDYTRRDVMIPMRDGVKLHTVILVPKGAKNAPILLTRTPYDATDLTSHARSSHLGPILSGYDNATEVIVEGGYIRVVQDVRGKYDSEGDYVMNRPLRGPLNPTLVDHATDTYDTIDWLVKNIPETNGKVGILGISYDGFTPLMALVNPHPALKVSVPMNPMVDGWMGDDWFHYGAFRQQNMAYIYEQEASRDNKAKWWTSHFDRSEEHTSELQSQSNLVCRLLLEKKKQTDRPHTCLGLLLLDGRRREQPALRLEGRHQLLGVVFRLLHLTLAGAADGHHGSVARAL